MNINYLIVLIIVMIGGHANIITISNITLSIAFVFTFFIFLKRNYKFDKIFIIFITIYIIVAISYYFKFGWIDVFRIIREIMKFTYAYIVFKMLKNKFIVYSEDIIYKLALISLPLYLMQLYDFHLMKQIIGIIEHTIPALDYRDNWYENNFIFTLNDRYMGAGEGAWRNSGFAWEPKGFASILSIAIFFNLIINNFKLNKRLYIMLIALITTFSTAGYIILLFSLVPFYILNTKGSLKIFIFPLAIIISIFVFFNTDRLKNKLISEIMERDKLLSYQYDRNYKGESRSMGRFGSLLLDYYDFKKEPIIGYGVQKSERTMKSIGGVKLVRVNGFSDLLAKYGLLGMIFWIVSLFLSLKKLSNYYKFTGNVFIVSSILMISFGSAIVFNPFFLVIPFIWMIKKYNVHITKDKKRNID